MKRIRDKFIGIWLTEAEKKELKFQANTKGLLPSTFIRMLLLDKLNAEKHKNS